jgi:hypothetical protein
MKQCIECNQIKNLTDFNKRSVSKDGLQNWCKSCHKKKKETYPSQSKEKVKEYLAKKYIEQKEQRSEYAKKKYLEKRDELLSKAKCYAQKTKDLKAQYDKIYREQNKAKIAEYKKQWSNENSAQIAERMKIYRQENVEKLSLEKSRYAKANRPRINARQLKYDKQRRAVDPLYRLAKNTRNMVLRYMVDGKRKRTQQIICCTYEELKLHIEQQFTEGMTWDNYGINGWHVDHIKPLASATCEEDIIALNHYTNLQPLWCLDNLSKGATFEGVNYKTKQ